MPDLFDEDDGTNATVAMDQADVDTRDDKDSDHITPAARDPSTGDQTTEDDARSIHHRLATNNHQQLLQDKNGARCCYCVGRPPEPVHPRASDARETNSRRESRSPEPDPIQLRCRKAFCTHCGAQVQEWCDEPHCRRGPCCQRNLGCPRCSTANLGGGMVNFKSRNQLQLATRRKVTLLL